MPEIQLRLKGPKRSSKDKAQNKLQSVLLLLCLCRWCYRMRDPPFYSLHLRWSDFSKGEFAPNIASPECACWSGPDRGIRDAKHLNTFRAILDFFNISICQTREDVKTIFFKIPCSFMQFSFIRFNRDESWTQFVGSEGNFAILYEKLASALESSFGEPNGS